MKQICTFLIFFLFFCLQSTAQAPTFSQFYGFPAAMNPAYVSAIKGAQVNTGYRRQWGQLQSGFDTKSIQMGIRSCNAALAFGGYFNQVDEPFFGYRQQEGGLQVGTFVPIQEQFSLHLGMQAGMGGHRVNFDQLIFSGQLDPVFGVQGPPSSYFLNDGQRIETYEIGGGIVGRGLLSWRNSDLPASAGVAVHHLAGSRDVSFLRVPHTQARRWTVHGSLTTPVITGIGKKDALYLNWVARYELENVLRRTAVGVICQYEAAHIGFIYQWNKNPATIRNTNGLTLTIGGDFELGRNAVCSVMYAYDGALGGLGQTATGGAHEIVAIFTLPNACVFKGRNNRGRTDCFDFSGKGYRKFLN